MYWKLHSEPSVLSRVYPGHLYYFFSISHHHMFQTYFAKKQKLEKRKSGNLEIQNPRFTNRSPDRCNLWTVPRGSVRARSCVVRCVVALWFLPRCALRVVEWSVVSFVAVLRGLVIGCVSGTVGRCAVLSGFVVRRAVVRGLAAQWSSFPDELVRCALCVVQCSVTTRGALRNP